MTPWLAQTFAWFPQQVAYPARSCAYLCAQGRLAMLAFLGFVGQHYANGMSPLSALSAHVASPFTANVAESVTAVPYLLAPFR